MSYKLFADIILKCKCMDAFSPLFHSTVSFFILYQKYKQTDFAKCVYKVDLKKIKTHHADLHTGIIHSLQNYHFQHFFLFFFISFSIFKMFFKG